MEETMHVALDYKFLDLSIVMYSKTSCKHHVEMQKSFSKNVTSAKQEATPCESLQVQYR